MIETRAIKSKVKNLMHPHSSPTFTATPNGILIDGMQLNKSASQGLLPQTLRYVKRAEEPLAKVKKEDWDNRTAHAINDVPAIAKAQMMLALASPQSFSQSLNRQNWQELTKDAIDDSDDEDDNSDNSDDGSYSGGGGGYYNPDEPRIPAGQPGGGQGTTGDGTDSVASSRTPNNKPVDDSSEPTYSVVPVSQTRGADNPKYIGTTNPKDVVLDDDSIVVDKDYNPIQMPSAASLSANIAFGESISGRSSIIQDGLSYPFGIYFPLDDADLEGGDYNAEPLKELAMTGQFAPYMPMDYQRMYATPSGAPNPLYVDFGNYNFGAVAAAAGYSLPEALDTAAMINARNRGNPNVDTSGPAHSNPTNNAFIMQGYNDYKAGKIKGTGK